MSSRIPNHANGRCYADDGPGFTIALQYAAQIQEENSVERSLRPRLPDRCSEGSVGLEVENNGGRGRRTEGGD